MPENEVRETFYEIARRWLNPQKPEVDLEEHDTRYRILVLQIGGGQFTEFVIHQRQQLLGSDRITLFNLGEDLRDFGHKYQHEGA